MSAQLTTGSTDGRIAPPMGLIAELTHRCPLQCPYCSNPLELVRASQELDTGTWLRVLDEAADLGVLQIGFSGGEPTARKDLPQLIERAHGRGMYCNLITSAVLLDDALFARLVEAGVDHVQISFQDVEAVSADRIGGLPGGFRLKVAAARRVTAAHLPLTLNFVIQRGNMERVPEMIQMGLDFGAQRIEIANVQYYGWGLANRAALLPTRAQLESATAQVEVARNRLKGRMVIDYVVPDYYARRPKACMGGWARRFINVSPAGKALPCHAAETLPGFDFPNVRDHSLAEIWNRSAAFARYRGTDWMPEPCRSCERREIDWGGCRCQAFALTGEAGRTDPACEKSPDHAVMQAAVAESEKPGQWIYRRFDNIDAVTGRDPVSGEATSSQ